MRYSSFIVSIVAVLAANVAAVPQATTISMSMVESASAKAKGGQTDSVAATDSATATVTSKAAGGKGNSTTATVVSNAAGSATAKVTKTTMVSEGATSAKSTATGSSPAQISTAAAAPLNAAGVSAGLAGVLGVLAYGLL